LSDRLVGLDTIPALFAAVALQLALCGSAVRSPDCWWNRLVQRLSGYRR